MSINKLIIIGNGFDLAHGLKTRYSDFVLWYLDRQYNILSHSYSTNKEDIISLSSGHTVPSSKIKSVKQFHDLIEGYTIKSESTNKLFAKILNETLSYNWVDIENIFYKELINIYKQHELNLDDIISTTIKKAKKLNNDLIAIKELLEIYLTEIENSSFDIKSEII
jgi:arsenate reductase-like glutaredoxin family protein